MFGYLKKKVDAWAQAGILTPSQVDAIWAFEAKAPTRHWVIYGIAGIGVSTVLTGIISIIAANWDFISPTIKLLCYFLLQGLFGFVFYKKADKPGFVREISLQLFGLLFLAGIGLTAQIYNLHSEGWQGLLFWLALMLPVTLLSRTYPPNHIWIGGFAITACIWVVKNKTLIPNEAARVATFASIPIWITAIGLWGQRIKGFPEKFRWATILWGFGVILLIGTPFGNALWMLNDAIDLPDAKYLLIPWTAMLVAIGGSLVRQHTPKRLNISTALMLGFAGVYLTIPFFTEFERSEKLPYQILGCAGFIFVWALAASSAALAGYKRLFDIASLIIAVRFIVVYFEVFGTLTTTGLGLIFSGSFILGIAYVWYKYRAKVGTWLGDAQ